MIRLINVHKAFGTNRVLRGCSLDIQDGETLSIIGGSGTGKSVTLKIMVGLLKLDQGQVTVDDEDITHMDEDDLARVQRKFSYVFQGSALFDSLTVGENVAFGLRQSSDKPIEFFREIIREKLALVGMKDIEHLKPAELSGGMRKRVAIARAIAMSPKYIFYDEPTTGLDPIMSDIISELIMDVAKKTGTTAIVVTHDMKSAYKISTRIAMLYEGQILEVNTPENIQHSANPMIQQFVNGTSHGPIQMKLRAFS